MVNYYLTNEARTYNVIKTVSSISGVGKIGQIHAKEWNSQFVKVLNVICETIKFLEENLGSKISEISCSNIFAQISSWEKETKEKINKGNHQQNEKIT